MKEVILGFQEILLNYDGIIGAILGVIATLITTHTLRNIGKIKVDIIDEKVEFFKKDPFVEHDTMYFNFKLKFYNTSDINKVIDNIEMIFLDANNKVVHIGLLNDLDTFSRNNFGGSVDELVFVNLPPKELVMKRLRYSLVESDEIKLEEIKSIKLRYYDKKSVLKSMKWLTKYD